MSNQMESFLGKAMVGAVFGLIAVAIRTRKPQTVKKSPDTLKYICVYCGSKAGNDPKYIQAAQELGKEIVAQGFGLVYGGGSVGLMGEVARAVDQAGGKVRGIIPRALMPRELTGELIQEQNVTVTETMHERKTLMAAESIGFIALPGGFGTFEEVLEAITWSQLGIHRKPVGLLNICGYYDHLAKQFETAVDQGFCAKETTLITVIESSPKAMIQKLLKQQVPESRVKGWKSPALDNI